MAVKPMGRTAALQRSIAVKLSALFLVPLCQSSSLAATSAPKPGSPFDRQMKNLLPKVKASEALPQGWVVETPTHVLHSTVSKEYTAAAAVHLSRFDRLFRSIFQGDYKDLRKPVAYAFATEDEYLKFSPSSNGTQGRFLRKPEGKNVLKDLAWFCTPPGEKDFYKTDLKVVQHEATHQLLDAYTDNPGIPCACLVQPFKQRQRSPRRETDKGGRGPDFNR